MITLLQQFVSRQAQSRPDAVAIVDGAQRITYRNLDVQSDGLAGMLRRIGCKQGERVALVMPKSADAIVAVLGILKAGCTYTPIDHTSPAARVAKILDRLDTRWLLAAGPITALLADLLAIPPCQSSLSIGWLDSGTPAPACLRPVFQRTDIVPCEPQECQTGDAHPAYILFTSGSTGVPKGVVITHANVLHFIRWAVQYFGIDSTDRLSSHTPLHFDLSVCDMFSAFAAGAELHLVPSALNLLPNKLAQFIRDRQLTQWFSVPSVLNLMAKFDLIQRGDFPSLRRVLWCGEVLPTPALMYWMERLPHTSFTNLYGPTETTIASSYYTLPSRPTDPHQAIPIGRPCAGETLHVLDEHLRPVAIGEMGHLFIGGVGLSPGYWREEAKTRAAFLPRPEGRLYKTGDLAKVGEDGLIYFLGRADSQIKSRGYRIELGEIETCLHGLGLLQESAVVAVPTDGFEGMAICCAYVPLCSSDSSPAIIRQQLATQLPAYMLPSRWLSFRDLPKNANGKIDRPRLHDMFHAQQSEVVP